MATQTTNYNLTKIALTDSPPDITVLNANFDTIDRIMKENSDNIATNNEVSVVRDEENTFRTVALERAISNGIVNLVIEPFDDTDDVDTTKGNGAAAIANYYDADKHVFNKQDAGTVTLYSVFKVVTAGANARVWAWTDFEAADGGSVAIAFSRDNGVTFTAVTNNVVTAIPSSVPSGILGVVRLTLTGKVLLKNIAWGTRG